MKKTVSIIIFTCLLGVFWLGSLIKFGNHPWVDDLRSKTRTLIQGEKNNDRAIGLDIQKNADYLATLRNKYADHPPVPEMLTIPAGVFHQGSIKNPSPHKGSPGVPMNSFQMAATETTLEQWDTCVALGGCSHMPDNYDWGRGNLPALNISFEDAQQYVKWLNSQTKGGYRIPENDEWEYAARAGTKNRYPWGNSTPDCQQARLGSPAWRAIEEYECSIKGTWPVGQTEPNRWGLYDVLGNVAEWTTECQYGSKGVNLDGISKDILAKIEKDIGYDCNYRVNRGGNLMTSPKTVNVFHSRAYLANHRYNRVGLRLARTTSVDSQ